jgi:serine protease AprX
MIKALVFFLSAFLTSSLFAENGKLAKDLESVDPASNVDVIVQYKQAPTETNHRAVLRMSGKLKHEFATIQARHYSIPATALALLAADPDVAYITPDRTLSAHLDQAQATIGASAAKTYGLTGAGVGVVVMDSGVGYSEDLAGKVVYEKVFLPNTPEGDNFGHGSHVAGIIAGSGALSTTNHYTTFTRTFQGVAVGVSLLDFQVLNSNGTGTDSAVIAALQQAVTFKKQGKYNIRVINLSLGRPVFESYKLDPLCQAVEQAWNAGIVVVVAAGNYGRMGPATTYGYGTITAPGNDPRVITVGAMKDMGTATPTDDVIASYSSKGPTLYDLVAKPDLVAPGNLIDSVQSQANNLFGPNPQTWIAQNLFAKTADNAASNDYMQLSGTSMATPYVSAAAALLIQRNPSLTPDQVKARLMLTAVKTTFPATSSYADPTTGITYKAQYDIFTIGAGYLNIANALASNAFAPIGASAASPALVFTSAGTLKFVDTTNVVWGSSVVWGDSVVWGSSVVWGDSVVWGSSVVWGDSNLFLHAANVVWGSSVVWGDSLVWASNVVWGSTSLSSQSTDAATLILVNGDR